MKLIFTITAFLLLTGVTYSQAPAMVNPAGAEKQVGTTNGQQYKLGAGESITLSPNPASGHGTTIQITAVNVSIFSYNLYNASGQIVEIENLSGRPNSNFFDLPDCTNPGIYYVQFETDSGTVTKKLMVN